MKLSRRVDAMAPAKRVPRVGGMVRATFGPVEECDLQPGEYAAFDAVEEGTGGWSVNWVCTHRVTRDPLDLGIVRGPDGAELGRVMLLGESTATVAYARPAAPMAARSDVSRRSASMAVTSAAPSSGATTIPAPAPAMTFATALPPVTDAMTGLPAASSVSTFDGNTTSATERCCVTRHTSAAASTRRNRSCSSSATILTFSRPRSRARASR